MREPNQHLAQARQRKAALLPRAAALAGEGRSYQEIAAALGIAKSTVCNWLRDRPLGRAAARSLGTPRMTARLAARYESVYSDKSGISCQPRNTRSTRKKERREDRRLRSFPMVRQFAQKSQFLAILPFYICFILKGVRDLCFHAIYKG